MSEPFVGEIRMFGGNFAPLGWALCQGQTMAIAENEALFQLIGTTYGGDGQQTFNLPDLRGRIPIHQGTGPNGSTSVLGQSGGVESVTLTTNQIPMHTHSILASMNNATAVTASGNVLAQTPSYTPYISGLTPNVALAPNSGGPAGGSQPHDNMAPFLCINFIISLFGIFPTQN
jgi:microcystin-dependent protein